MLYSAGVLKTVSISGDCRYVPADAGGSAPLLVLAKPTGSIVGFGGLARSTVNHWPAGPLFLLGSMAA